MFELPKNTSVTHYVQERLCTICGHKYHPLQAKEPWTLRTCIFRARDDLHPDGVEMQLRQNCLPAPVQEILNDFFMHDIAWSFDKSEKIAYRKGYHDRKHKTFIIFGHAKYNDTPNLDMVKLENPEKFVFPADKLNRWWPSCPEDKRQAIKKLYLDALEVNYLLGFKNNYQCGWLDAEEGKKARHRLSSQLGE